MNQHLPNIERSGSSDPGVAKSSAVPRRTLVQGAAWSLPVVALATAAPAYAASTTPGALVLSFDQSSYAIDRCGAPAPATVTAMRDGAPAVGETVTVTLPAGMQFADGTTSYTGVTDANGKLALPDLKAANASTAVENISGQLTATASGATPATATGTGTTGTGQLAYHVESVAASNYWDIVVTNTTCSTISTTLYPYYPVFYYPYLTGAISFAGNVPTRTSFNGEFMAAEVAIPATIASGQSMRIQMTPSIPNDPNNPNVPRINFNDPASPYSVTRAIGLTTTHPTFGSTVPNLALDGGNVVQAYGPNPFLR